MCGEVRLRIEVRLGGERLMKGLTLLQNIRNIPVIIIMITIRTDV